MTVPDVSVCDPLPAVTDPRAAMAPGAPLVHEARGSNVLSHLPIWGQNIPIECQHCHDFPTLQCPHKP